MTAPSLPDSLQAILFDKDGTLIDYDRTWAPVNLRAISLASGGDNVLAARLLTAGNLDPDTGKPDADSLFAFGNTREIAEAMISEGSRYGVDELTERLDALFQQGADLSVPVTNLTVLFETLRSMHFVIGIASNDSEAAILKTMEIFNLARYVEFACGYDSGHGVKPEPGMVHAFCAETGLEPGQVAVIGDNRHDMDMARSAGATAIAVLTGTGTDRSLAGSYDVILDRVDQLPALLRGRT